jgi:hypothetical protein
MTHVSLRLLGKAGRYPLYSVRRYDNLLICEPSLVWGATVQTVVQTHEEHSEVAVYRPEEVRLYASVVLSEADPFNNGWLIVEPWTYDETIALPEGHADLTDSSVEDFLREQAERLRDRELQRDGRTSFDRFRQHHGPYDLARTGDLGACLQLISSVDPEDRLCIRGLTKLLSSMALAHTLWFMEEAALAAYISLEAALQMIRQHLERESGTTASYDDVYGYLERTFPTGVPLVRFLREIHEIRNVIVHPSNRFGEFWAPPMLADDCYEAIEWLVPLYRHVLLGEVFDPDAA